MTGSQPTSCPFCSGQVPADVDSCPNCGATVRGDEGGELASGPEATGLEIDLDVVRQGGAGAGHQSPPAGGIPGAPPGAPGYPQQQGQPPPAAPGQPGVPGQPPRTLASEAGSFAKYADMTTPREPMSSQKILSTIGVFATVGIVTFAAYFYFFGFSQCGGCGGEVPPESITLDETASGEITGRITNRVYELELLSPATVTIACNGDFDNYLELYAEGAETPMQQDDDSGPGLNAMMTARLPEGRWYILVRPWRDGAGSYTLSVMSQPDPPARRPRPRRR